MTMTVAMTKPVVTQVISSTVAPSAPRQVRHGDVDDRRVDRAHQRAEGDRDRDQPLVDRLRAAPRTGWRRWSWAAPAETVQEGVEHPVGLDHQALVAAARRREDGAEHERPGPSPSGTRCRDPPSRAQHLLAQALLHDLVDEAVELRDGVRDLYLPISRWSTMWRNFRWRSQCRAARPPARAAVPERGGRPRSGRRLQRADQLAVARPAPGR